MANRVVELATRDLPAWGSDEEKELWWLLDLIQRGVEWVRWEVETSG